MRQERSDQVNLKKFFSQVLNKKSKPNSVELVTALGKLASNMKKMPLKTSLLGDVLWHYLNLNRDQQLYEEIRKYLRDIFWSPDLENKARIKLLIRMGELWYEEQSNLKDQLSFTTVLELFIPLDRRFLRDHTKIIFENPENFSDFFAIFLNFSKEKENIWEYGCKLLFILFDNSDHAKNNLSFLVHYFHRRFLDWFPENLWQEPRSSKSPRLERLVDFLEVEEKIGNFPEEKLENSELGIKNNKITFSKVRRNLMAALLWAINGRLYSAEKKGACIHWVYEQFVGEKYRVNKQVKPAFDIDQLLRMTQPLIVEESFKKISKEERLTIQSEILRSYWLNRLETYPKERVVRINQELVELNQMPFPLTREQTERKDAIEDALSDDLINLQESFREMSEDLFERSQFAKSFEMHGFLKYELVWMTPGENLKPGQISIGALIENKGIKLLRYNLISSNGKNVSGEITDRELEEQISYCLPFSEAFIDNNLTKVNEYLPDIVWIIKNKNHIFEHSNQKLLVELINFIIDRIDHEKIGIDVLDPVYIFLTQCVAYLSRAEKDASKEIDQLSLEVLRASEDKKEENGSALMGAPLLSAQQSTIVESEAKSILIVDETPSNLVGHIIPYVLKGMLDSYVFNASHWKKVYFPMLDRLLTRFFDTAGEEAIVRLNQLVTSDSQYQLLLGMFYVERYVLRQRGNKFVYKILPSAAWKSLDLLAQEVLLSKRPLLLEAQYLYQLIFRCLIALVMFRSEEWTDPVKAQKSKSICSKLLLACFRSSLGTYMNLEEDSDYFLEIFSLWDKENKNLIKIVDEIFQSSESEMILKDPVDRSSLIYTIIYSKYRFLKKFSEKLPDLKKTLSSENYKRNERTIANIAKQLLFFMDEESNPEKFKLGQLDAFLKNHHAQDGAYDVDNLVKKISSEMNNDQLEEKENDSPLWLMERPNLPRTLATVTDLSLSVESRVRAAVGAHRQGRLEPILLPKGFHLAKSAFGFSAATAALSWGALQFSFLMESEHFPEDLKSEYSMFFFVPLLSLHQLAYEYDEAKEGLHRNALIEETPTGVQVDDHRPQVDLFGNALLFLYCFADSFMRASGSNEVIEKYASNEKLQLVVFTPIFISTFRHFRIGEGFAFKRAFTQGLCAQDQSFLMDGRQVSNPLVRQLLVGLANTGSLTLGFSSFVLVFSESHHFITEAAAELLSINEENQEMGSYFLAGCLASIATVFTQCKLGTEFKKFCYEKLPHLLERVHQLGWHYFEKKHLWVPLSLAVSVIPGTIVLNQAMQEALEILLPDTEIGPNEDQFFWFMSALTAFQTWIIRYPNLENLIYRRREVNAHPEEPLSRRGLSYNLRLFFIDMLQLIGVSAPILSPIPPLDMWYDYLPSAGIMGASILARGLYHRHNYQAQRLPLEPHRQTQERSPFSIAKTLFISAASAIGLFILAVAIQIGLQYEENDESALRRVQLYSILISGFGVLFATRSFFQWNNRQDRILTFELSSFAGRSAEERIALLEDGQKKESYTTFKD